MHQFWDIEVNFDSKNKKQSIPKNHQQKIQCLTFLFDDTYYTLTYKPNIGTLITISSYNNNNVKLIYLENEHDLITEFFNQIINLNIDVLLGWYSNLYDLPYIIYRAIDNDIDLSKIIKNSLNIYIKNHRYKINTFFYSIELNKLLKLYGDDFQSMKLKDVAENINLQKKKINLQHDFYINPQKYLEYNINDVYLLKMIDERYNLTNLMYNSDKPLSFFT